MIHHHNHEHAPQPGLSGVLARGPRDGAELLGGAGAFSVLVEEREGLVELRSVLIL